MISSDPKVLVVGGLNGKFHAGIVNENIEKNSGHEAWAYAFAADYANFFLAKPVDINNYDLIIANSEFDDDRKIKQLISLAESRNINVKWATLIEGSGVDYLHSNINIKKLFDVSDLIICINKLTLQFFSSITRTKCEYIGIPYPVEAISKMKIPLNKRERKIFICPNLLSRQSDYLVAKEIGLPYYGWERRVHRTLKQFLYNLKTYKSLNPNWKINKAKLTYRDPNLQIRRDILLHNFFSQNSNSYIWINLDERYTWGRYVLDAAALGIPIITTKSTGHGEDLFPDTTLDNEFEVKKAIKIGKLLATDNDFYKYVSEYPQDKMEHFKAHNMKEKLLSFI